MLKRILVLMTVSISIAHAGDLTFIADAVNPGNGKKYKAYIDRSTIHREGDYETVKLVSVYENPISAAGFSGVKSMVNVFQINCHRSVKRVIYIGFLDAMGRVIVDENYPDAPGEPFGTNTVDIEIRPYLCTK